MEMERRNNYLTEDSVLGHLMFSVHVIMFQIMQ
jgi:hypothetical protein